LKTSATYLLCLICLVSVFFVSFNSTFKLVKKSLSIVLNESDFDDLEEEEENEKKEVEEDAKIISKFENIQALYFHYNNSFFLRYIETKLVSGLKIIQSPPPKV